MRIGVFNEQSLGEGRRIEVGVRGNKREGLAQGNAALLDLESCGQLDGIITPEKMSFRQPHSLLHETYGDAGDLTAGPEIGAKLSQRRGRISR
jgi:hypothetical protein